MHESPTEPITGLGFREPTGDTIAYLYVVTTNRVLSYMASGRGDSASATMVDEIGTGLGCTTMDNKAKDIIVVRDEAIYLCGIDGRGPCYAYEGTILSYPNMFLHSSEIYSKGHKSFVRTHSNYLVIVSPPFFPTASSTSATVRNLVAISPNATESDVTKVTVFDPENRLVAFSGTFKQGVREIVSQWGHIFVLTTDGKVSYCSLGYINISLIPSFPHS